MDGWIPRTAGSSLGDTVYIDMLGSTLKDHLASPSSWPRSLGRSRAEFDAPALPAYAPSSLLSPLANSSHHPQINFSSHPAPPSSPLPPKTPPKSTPSPTGLSPLLGALGLATLRLRSCPALLGNVGNIALLFGLGSSLKYA